MLPPTLRPLLVAVVLVTAACGTVADSGPEAGTAAAIDDEAPADGSDDVAAEAPSADTTAATDTTAAETDGDADEQVASLAAGAGASVQPPPATTIPDEPVVNSLEAADPSVLTVQALDPPLAAVGTGNGADTERAQWRLLELGFWVQDANGDYGVSTSQAVMAFQKYYGLITDGVLGPNTAAALSEVTERPTGRSTTGTLVEVDKAKQLVYIVQDGVTRWVLNTSTGSEVPYETADRNTPGAIQTGDSVTRTGLFEVEREREEGWWEGDLGEIYRPKYFDGGIALHGSYNIPDYPASHGCVRLSIPAMDWIWENEIIPRGTPVWVHGEIPEEFRPDTDS